MRWLLALSGLLSLSGSVRAGNWRLDASCEPSQYEKSVTGGMKEAFTLGSQLSGALDKLADKKPLAKRKLSKKDAAIHEVLEWIFLTDKQKLDEKTDFGALRRRLKALSGSSKRDDGAKADQSTIISYCDQKRWQQKQPKDENPRWHDPDFNRVVTYDPKKACEKSRAYVINGQQPGKEVNQLQMCPGLLKVMKDRSTEPCDKWCWKKRAAALKDKDPAPIDMLEEFPTTLFFALLFTTTKDTEGTACKTKARRAEKVEDDYTADKWAEHVDGDKTWLEITFRGWREIREAREAGSLKRDEKTALNDPSAAAHAARAIDMILNKGLTVDENGNVVPFEDDKN